MQKDIVLRAFLKKNMKLPELFEEKMRRLLGEDFSEYEKHLDDPAYYGIRVNTLKISVDHQNIHIIMLDYIIYRNQVR